MLETQTKKKRGQRGPGKKTLLSQQSSPQPQPISPQPQPASEDSNSDGVELDIESQASQPAPSDESGFGATLRRAAESVGLFDESDSGKIETRGRKSKKANQEEFNTLVIAVLTLIVSLAKIPQQVKPLDNELAIFSNHLTGILLRHLPINNGFSADALDIIGLFAVLSGYYARIQPELKAIQPKQKTAIPQQAPQQAPAAADPINDLSPAVGAFLRAAESKQAAT